MHYKDGTEAKLGDIARGRGYNLKHDVQGIVVGLNPGNTGCDIHVVTLRPQIPLGVSRLPFVPGIYEEHGTCGEFELVYREPALSPAPTT